MKKYLSLLLVILLFFAFLVSCSVTKDGDVVSSLDGSVTQDSTSQSIDNIPSDKSTNDGDTSDESKIEDSVSDESGANSGVSGGSEDSSSEKKDGYVAIKSWSEETDKNYYKTVSIKSGGYKGNDYPGKKGDYFKLFTHYEQLRSLYDTIENIEPVLFESYSLLMLYIKILSPLIQGSLSNHQ